MKPRGLIVTVTFPEAGLVGRPETKRPPVEVAVLRAVVVSGSPLALISGGVRARKMTVMVLRVPALRGPRLLQVIVPALVEVGATEAEIYCNFVES